MRKRLIILTASMLFAVADVWTSAFATEATLQPAQSASETGVNRSRDQGDTSAIEDLMSLIPEERPNGGNMAPGGSVAGLVPDNTQRQMTLAVQKWLKALGCYRGEIDGLWGPGSQRALVAAIGTNDAAAGATAANLSKIEAVAHKDVCKDPPARVTISRPAAAKAEPAKAARKKPRGCMSYSACMAGCADGTVGRGVGAICTFVCGSEVPVCPR